MDPQLPTKFRNRLKGKRGAIIAPQGREAAARKLFTELTSNGAEVILISPKSLRKLGINPNSAKAQLAYQAVIDTVDAFVFLSRPLRPKPKTNTGLPILQKSFWPRPVKPGALEIRYTLKPDDRPLLKDVLPVMCVYLPMQHPSCLRMQHNALAAELQRA